MRILLLPTCSDHNLFPIRRLIGRCITFAVAAMSGILGLFFGLTSMCLDICVAGAQFFDYHASGASGGTHWLVRNLADWLGGGLRLHFALSCRA